MFQSDYILTEILAGRFIWVTTMEDVQMMQAGFKYLQL